MDLSYFAMREKNIIMAYTYPIYQIKEFALLIKKKSFYLLFSNTPKITSCLSKTILRLLKELILENTEASFKRFLNFREENLYPLSGKHQT